MSTELTDLFERTMPTDDVILRKMASARLRREDHAARSARTRALWRSGLRRRDLGLLDWATLGASVLGAAALGLLVTHSLLGPAEPDQPSVRVERERAFPPAESKTARPGSAPPAQPTASAPAAQTGQHLRTEQKRAPSAPPSVAAVPPASTPTPEEPVVTASQPAPEAASWEAAAEALRSGDREKSARVLGELAQSDDPVVRDSARLVQLRSLVQATRASGARTPLSASARVELEALADSGQTASIRASARQLLEELERPADER